MRSIEVTGAALRRRGAGASRGRHRLATTTSQRGGWRPIAVSDCRRHRGLALLDILVAMAIGLMVMAAALGTLLLSRSAAAHVQELASLQQQGSFAMHFIGLQIRQAGAVDPQRSTASGLYAFDGADARREFTLSGTEGRDGAPDTLTLGYAPVRWPDPAARAAWQYDCSGARVERDARVQARFALDAKTRSLTCRSLRGNQPVIGQVADLQFRYRVAIGGRTRELDAAAVEAAALWDAVTAIEVCLDLRGDEPVPVGSGAAAGTRSAPAPDASSASDPGMARRDCSDRPRSADGHVHLVFRQLFHLRTS